MKNENDKCEEATMSKQDLREFFRHPAEIPIEVWSDDDTEGDCQYLTNISLGGLAFKSNHEWQMHSTVSIHLLLNPSIRICGTVVWCQKLEEMYQIGIKFLDNPQLDNRLKENMIDEVCEADLYKKILFDITENFLDDSRNPSFFDVI